MKRSRIIFGMALLCLLQAFCFGQSSAPLLPNEFAGWRIAGTPQRSKDAAVADPVNAALLQEYGFTDFEVATYVRDDGHKLTLRAARFTDATGAYGAFTYYKVPQMLREEIPDQASSWNERVLFYRSNILVDAVFQQLGAMSAAELRTLSANLPVASGSAAELPAIPTYLPKANYVKNSAKYVVGPVGLEKIGAPLSAGLVDFQDGAEVALGKYYTSTGEGTMVLVSYPTPQIAADRLKSINAARASNAASQSSSVPGFFIKRSGPIVAIVTGGATKSDADTLLDAVNYEANVTWNQRAPTARDNIGNVVVESLVLAGILGAFALIFGVAFGGFRLLLKRLHPERGLALSHETEFISLGLSEGKPGRPD
jgi:Family of unknown function (DUF6599)